MKNTGKGRGGIREDAAISLVDLKPDKCVIVGGPNSSGTCWLTKLIGDYLGVPIYVDETQYYGYGVVKTELLPKDVPKELKAVSSLFIYRDIRDVFISRYHKTTKGELFPYIFGRRCHMSRFLKKWRMHGYEDPLEYYNDSINAWLDTGLPYVRYEDLLKDTAGELAKLVGKLGWPVDAVRIGAIAEENRFDNLKKKGDMGWSARPGAECWKNGPRYFRSGRSGEWREKMPRQILDHITKKCGKTLLRAGYEI